MSLTLVAVVASPLCVTCWQSGCHTANSRTSFETGSTGRLHKSVSSAQAVSGSSVQFLQKHRQSGRTLSREKVKSTQAVATEGAAPAEKEAAKMAEQTYIMIKPDGVQRGLVGEIIARFERKGYTLRALKMMTVERSFAEKHYADLSSKPFFPKLVDYIISGPVVAMVWEGKNVVATGRLLIGATNPAASAPGTIRGDFAVEVGRNVIHGSDAVESAQHEISLWFPEGINEWNPALTPWIRE